MRLYEKRCPVCNSYDLDRVYQDSGISHISEVYLCEDHEISIEWGDPIVTEVRDSEGNKIPESEWE